MLVMEDDLARVDMLSALTRAGFSSVTAIDRERALDYLLHRPTPPATIMLDATTRGQTLLQLLNALAAVPGLSAVPVYLIMQKHLAGRAGGSSPS